MKLKKIISIICIFAIVLGVFAGCQKVEEDPSTASSTPVSTSDTPNGESSGTDPVDITIWFYPRYVVPGKDSGVFEQELIDEFRAVPGNEHINIKFEMLPWDSGPEKVNIAIQTNATPDAIFDFPGRIIGYGLNGALVPLDDMISPDVLADIDDTVWDHCKGDGTIYMYPTAITNVAVAVNAKIFRDAGIENLLPTNETRTWTTAEFENVLSELSKVEGIAPFGISCKNEQGDASLRMMIQSQGADFVSPDHKEIVINSPKGIEALDWIKSLSDKGFLVKNPETLTNANVIEMFMQGKTAMQFAFSAANIPTLQGIIDSGDTDPEFDLTFVTFPTPDGTSPKVEAQVPGYGVFDNNDPARAEATVRFIEYVSAKPETVAAQGIFPVRNSMDVSHLNEKYSDAEHVYLQSLIPYLADTGYTMQNYSEVRAAWYPEIQALLTNQKTAEEALNDFAVLGNKILSK